MAASAVLVSGSPQRVQRLTPIIQAAGWILRVHLDPTVALRDMREHGYDALFCDERLRGASASGFLAWHARLAPDSPCFVIAEHGHDLGAPLRGDPTQVLPFPLTAELVPPPPDTTLWHRHANPEVPLEGDTSTVPLAQLVELLGTRDGSAVIETRLGVVHLAQGRIEHATFAASPEAPRSVGLRALGALMAAEALEFRVLPHKLPPLRSVNQAIMTALTDAARRHDEGLRDQALLQAVREAHPQATGLSVGYALNATPDDVWGDGAGAHALLHAYARATAGLATIGQSTHLALEGPDVAWAHMRVRGDTVLAGTTARGKSMSLLTAMVRCVRSS